MYRLHYAVDNASLVVRLVLHELGQPFEAKLLDREACEQDSDTYRALQPLGLIPALETPDGPMFETAAIVLWLADRHAALAPTPASVERAAFLKWFFFTSSHIHPSVLQMLYPDRYAGAEQTVAAFASAAKARQETYLALLDRAAAARPGWLRPEEPSILGYYISVLCRWMKGFPKGDPMRINFGSYPALAAIGASLESRPAALASAREEGLGATIFTMPDYPGV